MCKRDCIPTGIPKNTGKEKHRKVSWYWRFYIHHHHSDLSLCVHHMSQDHLNSPNTVFCIVFPSVKYKLNIDQSMQLSLVEPRRTDWDVCLILTKNHMTSKPCDSINCKPDREDYCFIFITSCFLPGFVLSFNNTAFIQAQLNMVDVYLQITSDLQLSGLTSIGDQANNYYTLNYI